MQVREFVHDLTTAAARPDQVGWMRDAPERGAGFSALDSQAGGGSMIIAYTDGSCQKHTTRRGGWAVHVVGGEEYVGTEEKTTNQRMELLAACVALERPDGNVEIRSDSKYVLNCMNDSWWAKWFDPDTGAWRRSSVKNQDLWTGCSPVDPPPGTDRRLHVDRRSRG